MAGDRRLTTPWILAIASIAAFPLIGPLSVALLLAIPLAAMSLLSLGPGGLLYALVLGTWWLSFLYPMLAPPFLVAGVIFAIIAIATHRAALLVGLLATELSFLAYLPLWFSAPEVIASFVPDHAVEAWSGFFRSPASVLVVLAAGASCSLTVRSIGRRFFAPVSAAGMQTPPWQGLPRSALPAAVAVGAGCLFALTLASSRLPSIAWADCSEGAYGDLIRGCTIIIERGAKEPPERRITAHMRRASAYQEFGLENFSGAIADYSAAIGLDPTLAAAYAGRGMLHERLGEDAAAVADLGEALRLDMEVFGDGRYGIFRSRGRANYRLGEFDRALADHSEEIRLAPHYADGYLHRAAAHHAMGNIEQAIADFSEAIRVEPWRPAGYVGRGSIYFAGGDAARALADFDEAIRRLPESALTASAYRKRGEVLEARGDLPAALSAFEKAASLDPADGEATAARDRLRAALPR
jgi:Tfp pilus assembly protein PilF